MQSWLVSMETNQPPHLVALTHPTRRIADGGNGRMRKQGGGGRVENSGAEVRKTEDAGRKTDEREGREFCGRERREVHKETVRGMKKRRGDR